MSSLAASVSRRGSWFRRHLFKRVVGAEMRVCPSCAGEGEGLDWWGGSLETCPECRGCGRVLLTKEKK